MRDSGVTRHRGPLVCNITVSRPPATLVEAPAIPHSGISKRPPGGRRPPSGRRFPGTTCPGACTGHRCIGAHERIRAPACPCPPPGAASCDEDSGQQRRRLPGPRAAMPRRRPGADRRGDRRRARSRSQRCEQLPDPDSRRSAPVPRRTGSSTSMDPDRLRAPSDSPACWDPEPDIVVSGINAGSNLGDDVIYSGDRGGGDGRPFSGTPGHRGVARLPAPAAISTRGAGGRPVSSSGSWSIRSIRT